MADIIGGTDAFPGKNNSLVGTADADFIYADPYTGSPLLSGQGGNDRVDGWDGDDFIVGDAVEIFGTGHGGNDLIYGDAGYDTLIGDADYTMGERARGGNDELYGGGDDDTLWGDVWGPIFGEARGGNDVLSGGDGGDQLYGDCAQLNGIGGNDVLYGGAGGDALQGDSGIAVGTARCGNDVLYGDDGGDGLFGDAWLYYDARGGNDSLHGGDGDDRLYGEDFIIKGSGVGGDDRLDGGAGQDRIYGDAAEVYGHYDPDTDSYLPANARGGNDVVDGGSGNDLLWGDFGGIAAGEPGTFTRGHDRFVFANGSGLDTIFDFQDDFDRIDLTGFAGIDSFGEVDARSSQAGADVVIDLGAAAGGAPGADVLTLANFALANLNAVDFIV